MSITNFHASMTKTTLAFLTAASALVLSSCQDEDYGFSSDEIRDSVYDRNFVKYYGDIAPDQSWDLSKYAVRTFDSSLTRALPSTNNCIFDETSASINNKISISIEDAWYEVDPSLIEAFNSNLTEGVDNRDQGDFNFDFVSTGAPFYIVPLFQGISGLECDLHIVVKYNGQSYDKQIWTKSQNLQKQELGSMEWKNIVATTDKYSDYHNKTEYEALYKGSTIGAKATRSKPIRCIVPASAEISFYLHVTKGRLRLPNTQETPFGENTDANLAFTGVKQWSNKGQMISLSSSKFSIPQSAKDRFGDDANALILGCEDASAGKDPVTVWTEKNNHFDYTAGNNYTYDGNTLNVDHWEGDNDMNDLVFMFISDDLPGLVDKGSTQKRYLVEDLGSVTDWDFNDIIVDLYERRNEREEIVEQKAFLRHKCGTTDFDVFLKLSDSQYYNIFGTQHGEVQAQGYTMPEIVSGTDSYGKSAITKVDIQPQNGVWPWKSSENNIVVKVYPNTNHIIEGDGMNDQSDNISGNRVFDYGTDPTNQTVASDTQARWLKFPDNGKIPRIIAVDVDFPWTDENQSIEGYIWQTGIITTNVQLNGAGNDPGVVSGEGKYRKGEKVVLKAIANSGYRFVCWSDNSSLTNSNREVTVIDNEKTYTAVFEPTTSAVSDEYVVSYKVVTSGSATGSVSASSAVSENGGVYSATLKSNQSITLTATCGDANTVFSHWSDANGNIDKTASLTVASGAALVAHFVPKKTLTVVVEKRDWEYDRIKNNLQIWIKDGDNYSQMDKNATEGIFTKVVTNDNVTVIAAMPGDGQYNVRSVWSEGSRWTDNGNEYNNYERENIKGTETSFDNVPANSKKDISSIPDAGKVVTVGITYQVLVRYAMQTNGVIGDDINKDNFEYGSGSIHGSASGRQVFMHRGTNFSISATPNPGVHFVKWTGDIKTTDVTQPIVRNQINARENDGCYFVTAVFEENTKRNLKFVLNDNSIKTITVNDTDYDATGRSEVTAQIPEGADIKVKFVHADVKDEYNVKYVLKNNGNNVTTKEIRNGNDVNTGVTMPNSDLIWTVDNYYQTQVYIKDNANTNWGNSGTAYGSVSISTTATALSNNGGDAYLPKSASITLKATPNTGCSFLGWYRAGSTDKLSSDLEYNVDRNSDYTQFYYALFSESAPKHTLTLILANEADRNENISIWVNDVEAQKSSDNTKFTVQVAEGESIKILAKHNGSNCTANDDVRFTLNNSNNTWLTNNVASTLPDADKMPNTDKDLNLKIRYLVKVSVKVAGQVQNDISNICTVKTGYADGPSAYLEESAPANFKIEAKTGYKFIKWSNGGWSDTNTTATTHDSYQLDNGSYAEVKKMTITAELAKVAISLDSSNGYLTTGSDYTTYHFNNNSVLNELISSDRTITFVFSHLPGSGRVNVIVGNNFENGKYVKYYDLKSSDNALLKISVKLTSDEVTKYNSCKELFIQYYNSNEGKQIKLDEVYVE